MEKQVDFDKAEKLQDIKAMCKLMPSNFPFCEQDLYEIFSQEPKE